MTRAVGLLSGGLDSTLAAKLLLDQGIEVFAVNFVSPFCTCTPKSAGCASVVTAVRQLGNIPLKMISLGAEYLDMVRNPKFGYGKGINPCIDCRILKIRKALEYMREIGASFLFTGEVLGQRPMSQHRKALKTIDTESGAEGLILRPLSASHFPPTIAEKNGWVDRSLLLGIAGRGRKSQIALASQKGISEYNCPAGGCMLTNAHFAARLRNYLDSGRITAVGEIALLRFGRHFFDGNGNWIVVARNESEGSRLENGSWEGATLLVPGNFSAPIVLFFGPDVQKAIQRMLEFTNRVVPDEAVIKLQNTSSNILLQKQTWNNADFAFTQLV
jgi:hypothetical protein